MRNTRRGAHKCLIISKSSETTQKFCLGGLLIGIQYSCFGLWPISVSAPAKILHSRSRFRDSAMVRVVQGFRLRCLIVHWFWLMSVLIQSVNRSPGPFWHQLKTSILRSFIPGGWWYIPLSLLTREAWKSFHWAPLLWHEKARRHLSNSKIVASSQHLEKMGIRFPFTIGGAA